MIFNEIYSVYYNTVAKIISEIIRNSADEKSLNKIVEDNAFGESMFSILPSLKSEKWQLINPDFTTPIKHIPSMPLTLTEKRWLKAISLDPRIRLFGVDFDGLGDVEPLFTPDDYYIYDKYGDGDPYDNDRYISIFRTILSAVQNGQNLKIEMTNRKGRTVYVRCVPKGIEYSEKDDKFRLVTSGCDFVRTINIARITKCRIYNGEDIIESEKPTVCHETITLRISEERNTLERSLMHFAHFEKRAEKHEGYYLLHIKFQKDDEPEIVIRVLSFGPTVEVIGSEGFRKQIIKKLKYQKSCGLL